MPEVLTLDDIKARNQARKDFHSKNPEFNHYSADSFIRAVDDCDGLLALIEGEPTALEKGASVDDVMQAFEDNLCGHI